MNRFLIPRGYVSLLGFHSLTVTCNILYDKNPKYKIYNIDIKGDVSLCINQIIQKRRKK